MVSTGGTNAGRKMNLQRFKNLQKPAPRSHREQAKGYFTKPDGDFESIALIIMISLIIVGNSYRSFNRKIN